MPQQASQQQWEALRASERRLLDLIPTPVAQHDIELGGERYHYLEAGSPTLPTLVMLHGRGSASALWQSVFPLLAPHRHLIAIDMRGWGLTERTPFTGTTGEAAIAWWRDGAMKVVDALKIDRFDLMGHSLGGFVALAIALVHQARIDHLVLEDAAGLGTTTPFFVRLYFNIEPERAGRLLPRSVFDRLSRGSVAAHQYSPATQQALGDFVYRLTTLPGTPASGARAFNKVVSVSGVHFTLRDRVHEIATMTRAIWGEQDHTVPLRDIRAGLATIPHAELITLPKADHSPHMEMPQPFANAVLEFLARGNEIPVTRQ